MSRAKNVNKYDSVLAMEFKGQVTCVGLVAHTSEAAEEEQHYLILCCQQRKQPVQFFLTLLTDQSSALVSPFYEHSVALVEAEHDRCPWAPAYHLKRWERCQFRIPPAVDDEREYTKQARDIIRQTFFPLLQRPAQLRVAPWHRQCFDWQVFRRGLSVAYTAEFDVAEWLGYAATPAQYWSLFGQRFSATLNAVMKSLKLESRSAVCHDLAHLGRHLDHWYDHPHIAALLRYRLEDMLVAQRVAAASVSGVPFAHLSQDALADLGRLYGSLATLTQEATPYLSFATLLGRTLRLDALQTVLAHFDSQHAEAGETTGRRKWLLDHLVLRHIGEVAQAAARTSPSTVYPLSVKHLTYLFGRLFHWLREAPSEEEEEGTRDDWHFGPACLGELVDHLWHTVAAPPDAHPPWFGCQWRLLSDVPPSAVVTLKPSTGVCCVMAKPRVNQAEEALRALLTETLKVSAQVEEEPGDWDAVAAQRHYESLDDIDALLYDVRVTALLFRPVEFTQNHDLKVARDVLAANIFTCLVVRPADSDFSLRRLEAFFASGDGQPSLRDLRQCCVESGHWPQVACETVVVVDCHLYSIEAMLALWRWLAACRAASQPVRRLVMLGALDTLPLHCDGQAWLDALASLGYEPSLFRHAQMNAALDELLECRVRGHLLRQLCLAHNSNTWLQDYVVAQLLGRDSGGSCDSLRFCCLAAAAAQGREDLAAEGESGMTVKFRTNNSVKVETVTLAHMCSMPVSRHTTARYCYFVTRAALERMTRNELNHLLVETLREPLVVLLPPGEKPTSFKWLHECAALRQQYPNARYTARLMHTLSLVNK
jgi:hypothetical protein